MAVKPEIMATVMQMLGNGGKQQGFPTSKMSDMPAAPMPTPIDLSGLQQQQQGYLNEAYGAPEPQMGSPIGKNELPWLLAGLVGASVFGASNKDINEGFQGFLGSRESMAQRTYQNKQAEAKRRKEAALAKASMTGAQLKSAEDENKSNLDYYRDMRKTEMEKRLIAENARITADENMRLAVRKGEMKSEEAAAERLFKANIEMFKQADSPEAAYQTAKSLGASDTVAEAFKIPGFADRLKQAQTENMELKTSILREWGNKQAEADYKKTLGSIRVSDAQRRLYEARIKYLPEEMRGKALKLYHSIYGGEDDLGRKPATTTQVTALGKLIATNDDAIKALETRVLGNMNAVEVKSIGEQIAALQEENDKLKDQREQMLKEQVEGQSDTVPNASSTLPREDFDSREAQMRDQAAAAALGRGAIGTKPIGVNTGNLPKDRPATVKGVPKGGLPNTGGAMLGAMSAESVGRVLKGTPGLYKGVTLKPGMKRIK